MEKLKNTHFIFFSEGLKDYYKKNNFRDYFHSDLTRSKDDFHPSAKGHYLKAELIYGNLLRSGILKSLMRE